MSGEYQHTYICENYGNEASLTIKKDEGNSAEYKGEPKAKKGMIVCKICGNEADMILEEI
jgi:thymidine kinase